MNLYAFVRNNPPNKWDYLGMSEEEEFDELREELARIAERDAENESHLEAAEGGIDRGAGVSTRPKPGMSAFGSLPQEAKTKLCDTMVNPEKFDEIYGPGLMDDYSKYGGAFRESALTIGRYENTDGMVTEVTSDLVPGDWWIADNITDPFDNKWRKIGPNGPLPPVDGDLPSTDVGAPEYRTDAGVLTGIYSFHTHPLGPSPDINEAGLSNSDRITLRTGTRYGSNITVPFLLSGAFDGRSRKFYGNGEVVLTFDEVRSALGCK